MAVFLLNICIAFAGMPANASVSTCPMAMHMQMKDGTSCAHCLEMMKNSHGQKQKGCCDGAACNAKCTVGNASPVVLTGNKAEMAVLWVNYHHFVRPETTLHSATLQTKDRPPKSFA